MSRDGSRVGLVATLALVGLGALYASPTLLAGAAVPLTYAWYAGRSRLPAQPSLRARRTVEPAAAAPGETVRVRLTVTNAGERALADLRVVDGVPGPLAVTEGSPRACFALDPGGTGTVEYAVRARRGTHEFGEPAVRLRSLAGTDRETRTVPVEGGRRLRCRTAVREPPAPDPASPRTGTVPTGGGGSGLEFFATREYRPGDPVARIDWRHYAKTGEFVTVQYRDRRAVETVLVVDARPPGRVAPDPGSLTGAELSVDAAERLHGALGAARTAGVAVAGLGDDAPAVTDSNGLAWTDGDGGADRIDALFDEARAAAGDGAASTATPAALADGGDRWIEGLLARLPAGAQVVVCTPLLDGAPVECCRRLAAAGHPTVVLSPDVTGGGGIGRRTVAVERTLRVRALDRSAAATVGWDPDEPLDRPLRRSLAHLE